MVAYFALHACTIGDSLFSKTYQNNTSKRLVQKFNNHLSVTFLFTVLATRLNLNES